MKRIYQTKIIKAWYAYEIDEICDLYSKQKLHPQTIHKWTRAGLKTIDSGRPTLIFGNDLKVFLQKNNLANKHSLQFHEFFCVKCKEAKNPLKKQINLTQEKSFLRVKSICPDCKIVMNRTYTLQDFSHLKKIFLVSDVLQLNDSANCPTNTHLNNQEEKPINEPKQLTLNF